MLLLHREGGAGEGLSGALPCVSGRGIEGGVMPLLPEGAVDEAGGEGLEEVLLHVLAEGLSVGEEGGATQAPGGALTL